MGAPWSRVVNTTIKNYLKEAEVNVLRNRKLLALARSKGRITFNWSGISMVWRVKYKRVKPSPFADGDTRTYSRKDRYKTAELDWRGYDLTDSMTKGEYLQNRGAQAIINTYSEIASDLMEDMEESFSEELYIDGYLPANGKRIHGFESFMQGNPLTGNGAATPSGTYAGLPCTPGAISGTWNPGSLPAWPNGRGDTAYDFWSPLIVAYDDALFGGATWSANCVEAVSFAIIKSKKSKSAKGMLDLFLMDDEMYRVYLATLRGKERIEVNRDGSKSPLVGLGFSDTVNQDGVDLTWEYGIIPDTAYGINVDMIEIRSQQAQMFVPEGPNQDDSNKSWNFGIDFYGNMVANPKFQVALKKTANISPNT